MRQDIMILLEQNQFITMRMRRKDDEERLSSPYKKQLIEIARLANYEPIASIPGLNNGFNFTVLEDGLLKKKIRDEVREEENITKLEKRTNKLETKLPKIPSKANKFEHYPTNASENYQNFLTSNTREDTDRALSPKSPNILKRAKQSPNRDRCSIRYKIKALEQEAAQSGEESSDGEYSTNATPGPGYYSVNNSDFFNRSRPATKFSFGSRAERFEIQPTHLPFATAKQKQHDILKEQQKKKKHYVARKKKIIPFLSSSLTKRIPVIQEITPAPVDYHPRFGIEEQLIKKIQRNFKGNFGVCQERFKERARASHLGPGCYSPDKATEDNPELGSYYFKSEKKRF